MHVFFSFLCWFFLQIYIYTIYISCVYRVSNLHSFANLYETAIMMGSNIYILFTLYVGDQCAKQDNGTAKKREIEELLMFSIYS